MAHRTSFLSGHRDVMASFFFWRVECADVFSTERRFLKLLRIHPFILFLRISSEVLINMSSPGQKRGTCGHIMTSFDGHLKCARCRDKGVGEDDCVVKKDCSICKAFTPEQVQQLATPTYRERIRPAD